MAEVSLVVQSADDDDERLKKLLVWANSRNIWINDDIRIGKMNRSMQDTEECPSKPDEDASQDVEDAVNDADVTSPDREKLAKGEGFGVYVKPGRQLIERQVAVLIPKTTILSARTSSLATYIPEFMLFSSDATSGLLLSLVLLHELLLGEQGPWWGYLQSLPRHEGRWGVPLPQSLEKTSNVWKGMSYAESGRMITRAEADPLGRVEGLGMSVARLRSFFRMRGLPILKKSHSLLFDGGKMDKTNVKKRLLDDYIRAHSIISSRTFIVDMYHGMCLVPIADMFNHSEQANTHFEADDEVCDECGALGSCPHSDDPLPSAAYGRPSQFLPAERGPNSVDWEAPKALEGVDTVDMVAQETIEGEEELYNTYGNFSNATLLSTYGFSLEYDTEWDRYVWEWRNEDERKELLDALLHDASRRRANDGEEDDDLLRWVRICAQFTNLKPDAFGELMESCIGSNADESLQVDDFNAPLHLPIDSPFLHLALPTWAESNQEGSGQIDSVERKDIFADHSTHDGTKDKYQPLYVDSEGRISVSLWRTILLYHISKDTGRDKSQQNDPRTTVNLVERIINSAIMGADNSKFSNYLASDAGPYSGLIKQTLNSLNRLVSQRANTIRQRHDQGHEGQKKVHTDRLSILQSEPSLRRSIALQTGQELLALETCQSHLQHLIDQVNAKSAPAERGGG